MEERVRVSNNFTYSERLHRLGIYPRTASFALRHYVVLQNYLWLH